MQSHALIRLAERLDCIDLGLLNFHLYKSLKNPKLCKNKQGNLLFEYRFEEFKLGYLLAEIHKGIILIKTFLFITNFATPEGDWLNENLKLEKEDFIYLNIDKLSTFINSDIDNNEIIKDLFVKAGCGSLFEYNIKTLKNLQNIRKKTVVERIAKHLGISVNEKELESLEK